MKNPNKISFAESFRLSAKTFRLLFREYPQMYLSRIVFVAWEALTPYVGIYISALLIGEIASSRDPKRLTVLAVAALIAAALTALGTALLKMWKDNSNTCDYTKISKLYTEKFLNMDFVSVDDPKTHELYSEIMQLINGNGWGLPSVVWQTESLASAVATLFGGVVLTVSLFAQKVPSGNALSVLNNPVCIIALIGVMLAATLTAPALMTKANSYYSQNSDTHNLVNRLFGYYGFCGDEKNIASPCPAGDGGGRPGADRCRAHGQHEGVGCVGIDARTRPGRVRPPDGRPRFDGCRRDRPDDFDVRGYE